MARAHLELRRRRAQERARSIGLREFVEWAWPIVEPGTPFVGSWHVDAICEHLEAVTAGDIRRLLINIPPGHAKSLLVSVFWPAWVWLRDPAHRLLCAANALELSTRDNVRARYILESSEYQEAFRPDWHISTDQNVKRLYKNSEQGFRQALSVGAKITGHRGNTAIIDDPIDAEDVYSEVKREEAKRWFDKALTSRLHPQQSAIVVIMQRLHEDDLSGHLLERGGFEHLCLPSEFEPDRACETSIGFRDPRTEKGELLFDELYDKQAITEAKKDLGPTGYAGQHQQRPSVEEGDIWKRPWFRRWNNLPADFDEVIQSWDCSFKDKKTSSMVVGGVWGKLGPNKFRLDEVRAQMGLAATIRNIRAMQERWPQTDTVLVEDKANGTSVIEELQDEIAGIIPVEPAGGKVARAYAVQGQIESGHVWLPPDAEWVEDYLDEVTAFPNGRYDDRVDETSQALRYLKHHDEQSIWDLC